RADASAGLPLGDARRPGRAEAGRSGGDRLALPCRSVAPGGGGGAGPAAWHGEVAAERRPARPTRGATGGAGMTDHRVTNALPPDVSQYISGMRRLDRPEE